MHSYAKGRTVPMNVSVWMDKNVNIRKATVSSGLMPDNTRNNVFLSRKFYSDMFRLSTQRHKQMARFDLNKKVFLKTQLHKAEKSMPGLLPYIERHKHDMDHDSSSRLLLHENDQLRFPSVQSFATHSVIKSEVTDFQKKPSRRQQALLEKVNHLAQPKGRRFDSPKKDHNRPAVLGKLTVKDLFGNIDDISTQNSVISNGEKTKTDDKRFRQLVHLFSEVHERPPETIQSVKTIIESNESLQNNAEQWDMKSIIEEEYDEQLFNESSSFAQTDMYLIDAYA